MADRGGRSRKTINGTPGPAALRPRRQESPDDPVCRPRAAPIDLAGVDRMIGYAVRRAQIWMMQDLRRALSGLGITPAQLAVLQIIAANPGLSQARIAEALAIERARLVQMLDYLEGAGRLRRRRSAVDRRSHALHLTEAGAELIKLAQGPLDMHERNMEALVGPGNKDLLLRILAPFLRL